MASVNKNKCYNIIENYLLSRLTTWKINPEEITSKELFRTPHEKREICFTLIDSISKCSTTDDWMFLIYMISDIRNDQKSYETGTLSFFANEQTIISILDKLKYTILESLQHDGPFIDKISKLETLEQSLTNKQTERSKHRKYHGKICKGALSESQAQITQIRDQLHALNIDNIPAENRVVDYSTSNNSMVKDILRFLSLTQNQASVQLSASGSYSM